MTQPLSRYRRDARERIEAALAALPADATRRDAEKAITAVNPYLERFSGDGNCWARQCWSRERVAALNRRFPVPHPRFKPQKVRYELVTAVPRGKPWLRVKCGWCGVSVPGRGFTQGCLVCVRHCERVKQIVALPEFRALRAASSRSPEVVGVLRDWLLEQGVDVGGEA